MLWQALQVPKPGLALYLILPVRSRTETYGAAMDTPGVVLDLDALTLRAVRVDRGPSRMMRIRFLHTVVGTGVQNLRMPWECVCVCVRTHVLKQTTPLL